MVHCKNIFMQLTSGTLSLRIQYLNHYTVPLSTSMVYLNEYSSSRVQQHIFIMHPTGRRANSSNWRITMLPFDFRTPLKNMLVQHNIKQILIHTATESTSWTNTLVVKGYCYTLSNWNLKKNMLQLYPPCCTQYIYYECRCCHTRHNHRC